MTKRHPHVSTVRSNDTIWKRAAVEPNSACLDNHLFKAALPQQGYSFGSDGNR
jgi:hypothetical protein